MASKDRSPASQIERLCGQCDSVAIFVKHPLFLTLKKPLMQLIDCKQKTRSFTVTPTIAALVMLVLRAASVSADTVTYDFAGAMTLGGPGPIAVGTPFSGSFTLDLSTPGQPGSFSPTSTDYDQQLPPASFSFTVAGLTVQATDAAIADIDHQSLIDNFSLFIQSQSLTGPGWSFTPSNGIPTSVTLNLQLVSGSLSDLAHLPNLGRLASLPIGPKVESIALAAGDYTYPGGSFTLDHRSELHFTITSLALVPEPSGFVGAMLGVCGLLAWRRRAA